MNQESFENAVKTMIKFVGEDINRKGLKKTPLRVLKAYEFMFGGYKLDAKKILKSVLFETTNDEMVVVKDIDFFSTCEHHLLPIIGHAHVAYIPNKKVVGLSKIPRVVDVFARRMQIQEQMTEQIADLISSTINPKGVAVVIQARHMCMEMRGVQKANLTTTTSALRGLFKLEDFVRKEFFAHINSNEGYHF